MYFVIFDTVHLFQNYSVDECDTQEEAFKKLDEAKRLHGWRGWVAKEVERPTSEWSEYPKCKPDRDGPDWYYVALDDGSVMQACWWGVWYCFPEADRIVKFSTSPISSAKSS